ncbi:MAG: MBL fold metallo-hydrolase [Clostridiales Family XIII bacterium]|jgi:phosphoribosyl 1,2-cyclic phosphodiesterase|nr:MBL fold metallo-hydrolase [Clostridiales Family XIII bacterium]
MALRFCSFSSGSSGNCYLVRSDDTALLVDTGISAARIMQSLVRAQTDADEIRGILITHEHSDHISGLTVTAKRLGGASVFATGGTLEAARQSRLQIVIPEDRKETFHAGEQFNIGDIGVKTVSLSHDAADPAGYILRSGNSEIAIITDTGVFSEEMVSAAADADILVIESNHDEDMLIGGHYPPFLKQRILSEHGHLSNKAAANAIIDIMALEKKQRCILLAHLSRDNNTPQKAQSTALSALAEMDYYSGRDLYLKPLLRDRMSVVFEI